MTRRANSLLVLSAVSAAACAGMSGRASDPAPPTHFRYEASRGTYAVASHRVVDSDIQGQATRVTTVLRYTLTAELQRDSAGALSAVLTVDSVQEASGPDFGPDAASRAAGARFTGIVGDDGALEDFAGGDGSMLIDQVAFSLSRFLPKIPPGGLAPGDRWADTTTTTRPASGAVITVAGVTRYETGGWTQSGDARVLPVTWVRTYTVTGHGDQMGQPFTIEGTGQSTGEHRLTDSGRYAGSATADSSSSTVVLTQLGIEFPVIQVGADTVAVVR